MCLSIPSRVVALHGEMATVECFGERRDVSLMLLAQAPALGDYLLVQAGGFAYERVEPSTAMSALQMLGEMMGAPVAA